MARRTVRSTVDRRHRELAQRINALRVRQRLSQNYLADFAGVSRAQMSRILSGQQSPTYKTILKIAEALNVSVSALTDAKLTPPDDV
jgi:transcriptional regulator with XRE-family HTH domain